ncbi:MAG TPA: ABC transporter permease [Candidatus Acidoferrales bacterium]|nr:ABC transporter permease [Candidatus Acidoferrales bacterium]
MRYLARRLVHAILLLIAISMLSFMLLQWTPGDFFDTMRLDPRISAQTVEGLRSQFGVNQSFGARYLSWTRSLMRGNMGYSLSYDTPVAPLLWSRAKNTLLLAGISALLAWMIAIPIGIWSAASKGGYGDKIFGTGISTLLAIPDLVLFLVLLLIAVRTGWFPTGGMISSNFDGMSAWQKINDGIWHFVLPSAGLAIVMLPVLVRHIRSAMIEALESPFIRAARAHGIPRMRILLRYALLAASNPLISLLGFSIATILSGSAILEVIMSWPGLGPVMVQAILSRDVNVVAGIVMLSSVFLVAGNLFADVLLVASDPRIRAE